VAVAVAVVLAFCDGVGNTVNEPETKGETVAMLFCFRSSSLLCSSCSFLWQFGSCELGMFSDELQSDKGRHN
jgi:predicted membrane channel-forming protein YqfA (hemolysin III family)